VQGVAVLGLGDLGFGDVVAIGLVDDDAVGHFHDAPFDALQFITPTGNLDEQEEIDHGVNGCFRLANAYRFHKNGVKTSGFAEHNGFPGLAGHAAQGTGRRGRANEGVGVYR